MKMRHVGCLAASIVQMSSLAMLGEPGIVSEHHDNTRTWAGFKFEKVPAPSRTDAATTAVFSILDGRADRNGGGLDKLHDGKVPTDEDQPDASFFFEAGSAGGRLLVDLGKLIEIKQINTYSWHASDRGPQVYTLYASDGEGAAFNASPKAGPDPGKCGWKQIATVDTRPQGGDRGGQYGVSLAEGDRGLGKYRYLLFDCSRTEADDAFGNTFYSEIDVVDLNAPPVTESSVAQSIEPVLKTIETEGSQFQITIDTTASPDLTDWVEKELTPVVRVWYPKLVKLLPSEGYTAPARIAITFKDGMGGTPAATGGGRISCNSAWFRRNLKGEAAGSVVHEMVHVVQQYGRVRRDDPNATRTPGWLVEGIADYIRWFLFEPQTKGAEITERSFPRARYDASYRVTGNFLNWATEKYDRELVVKLNAAARQGRYREDMWKSCTGKTLAELGDEWRESHRVRLGIAVANDGAGPTTGASGAVTNR